MTAPPDDPGSPTRHEDDPWARPDQPDQSNQPDQSASPGREQYGSPEQPYPSAPPFGSSYPPAPAPGSPDDPYRFGPPGPNAFGYPQTGQQGHPLPGQPGGRPPGPPPYQAQPGFGGYPASPAPPGYPAASGYPASSGYPTPAGGNGKAVAGLVLGILALVFFWLTVLDLPLIVLGIVFSALGLAAAKRGQGRRRMAMAGLICSIVGALAATIFFVWALNRTQSCADKYDRGSTAYQICVREGN